MIEDIPYDGNSEENPPEVVSTELTPEISVHAVVGAEHPQTI